MPVRATVPLWCVGLIACTCALPAQARTSGPRPKSAAEIKAYADYSRLEKEARRKLEADDLPGAEKAALAGYASRPWFGKGKPTPESDWLLGEIYIRQENYQKALHAYLPNGPDAWRGGAHLPVALCYARLGKYDLAKRFFLGTGPRQEKREHSDEYPGTATPQALEASILLARGTDMLLRSQSKQAVRELDKAHKLAPDNGLIAFYLAQSLDEQKRTSEAIPFYRQAAKHATGRIREIALTRAQSK